MGTTYELAKSAFRDFTAAGVPSSGDWEPVKSEIIAVFADADARLTAIEGAGPSLNLRVTNLETAVDALEAGQGGGAYVFSTKAAMDAFLTPDANARAEVIGDPTPANDGVYGKVGAGGGGSWTYIGPSVITSVNGTGFITPPRTALSYVQGVDDPAEAVAVGVLATGETDLALSARALRRAADARFQTSAAFRGFRPIAGSDLGEQLVYGLATQGGHIMDVAQRRLGVYTTAMAITFDPVTGRFYYGQSNAGAGSGEAPGSIADLALYPYQVVQFANQPDAYGTAFMPGALTDFREAVDSSAYGQSPCSTNCWAAAAYDLQIGARPKAYLSATAWEGGQDITHFTSGSTNWDNLIEFATRSPVVCAYYGKEFVLEAVFFVHGEAATVGYGAALEGLIDSLVPALTAATGQATDPLFIFNQINSDDTAVAASGVELAQLQVGIDRLGTGAVLAGPMYQYPLHDVIHVNKIGRLMKGDHDNYVARQGADFVFTYATGCTRSGATIDITYAGDGGNLAMDTAWMIATALNGFKARKSSDSSVLTINSVTITGANTVRLVLSADPGGKVIWSYAMQIDSTSDHWASGRGQLCRPTTEVATYYTAGYAVPQFITNYACRQEMETPT